MNLREALGVPVVPEFELELPDGWARHGVDDASLEAMLAAAKQRCMEAHAVHLYAEVKGQLEAAFASMRKGGVFAFFAPTTPGDGTLAIPSSINASIRSGEPGQTLDNLVRTLIRDHGATPLLGDHRTLRVEKEKTTRVGTEIVINHSVVYLTPIPGAKRRRALSLVAGFARTPDIDADSESINSVRLLFDACVSTLQWR
ncbi:protein TPRXL [Nocardioides sp. WG-D5]|uniref:protein TPRXL n=1 Tax=Nocardioides luteus TaxID=1844 RepID=UPI0018CBD22C|nr:protein TPRXL [Nocardioides luteus]MBG6098978.1 hypothetical protein [Nocardioides luteus]